MIEQAIGTRYFHVRPDHTKYPDQWILNEPYAAYGEQLDSRDFCRAMLYTGRIPVTIPVSKEGRELAFSFAAFDMPVVSRKVANILEETATCDIQLFPITVAKAHGEYVLLNVVVSLDCLDETRSEVTRWQERDCRPERLGQVRSISQIRVDHSRIGNHHVFRLKDWPLALLVSDAIKREIERIPDLGLVFRPVS